MTVNSAVSTASYTGNGTTQLFPVPFYFLVDTDLKVSRKLAGATGSTVLTLNSDYTLAGAGNSSGGTLAMLVAPASGDQLFIERNVAAVQQTAYPENNKFPSASHEKALDRLTMLIQQALSKISFGLFRDPLGNSYDLQNNKLVNSGTASADADVPNLQQVRALVVGGAAPVLVGPSGSSTVGFIQSGTGALARTVQDKLRETVSILDFGGAGDGVTDNATAWARASAAAGANGVVRFPGRNGTTYYFGSDPNIATSFIDADPGVRLAGNVGVYSGIRVLKPVPLDVALGQNFTHDLTPEFAKDWHQKDMWMADGDLDRSVVKAINAQTGTAPLVVAFAASDTFNDASAQVTFASSSQVQWGSSPADASIRCSMVGVRPGDEINFSFVDTGTYRRAAIVRTSAGYYWVYADGNGTLPHFGGKLTGQAAVDNTFSYEGVTDHPAYYPENSDWTIRIIDRNRFAVLINGLEVTNVQTVQGDIYQAGPGIGALGAAKTINVAGFSRWQNRPHGGKRGQTVLCIGDSVTDGGVHGGWPYAMREALAGSFGIRLLGLYNQAISGDNIDHQLQVLQANGTHGASVAVIALGTNDAQFNSSVAGYITNLTTMVTFLRAASCEPVIWLHQAWYEQTQSGGGGQASVNSGSGGYLRSLILRFCADNSVKCIDMRNVSGAITSTLLLTGKGTKTNSVPIGVDPWVRDNIHPTTHGYRVMGFNIARAVAGLLNPQYRRSVEFVTLPAALGQNNWTTSVQALQYSVGGDGMAQLCGVLNRSTGTAVAGEIMYKLPAHLCPLATTRAACPTNTTGFANVRIDVAGNMYIDNPPASTTFVDVSAISFQTAG